MVPGWVVDVQLGASCGPDSGLCSIEIGDELIDLTLPKTHTSNCFLV